MPSKRLRSLQSMPDEELERLLEESTPTAPEQGGGFKSLVSVFQDPAVDLGDPESYSSLFSPEAASAGIQNIPHSLANRARELEALVRDPGGTVKALGNLAVGAGDVFAEQFGAEETERSRMAKQVGREYLEGFTPGNIIRDPTRPIADIASLLVPFLPKGVTAMGKVGRVTQALADPIGEGVLRGARVASVPAKAAARKVKDFTAGAAAEMLGFSTGIKSPAIREAFKAGFEGNVRPFLDAIADRTTPKDIGREVIDKLKELDFEAGKAKGAFVDNFADVQVNIKGLMDEITQTLAQQNITRTARRDVFEFDPPPNIDKVAAAPIEEAVGLLANLGDTVNLKTLDGIKQRVSQLFRQGKRSGVTTTNINDLVRKRLNQVDGYEAANKPVQRIKDFLEELNDEMGIRTRTPKRPKGRPKQAGKSIVRAVSEGADDDLALVARIEKFTGIPLRAKAAGQKLSQTLPGGAWGQIMGAGIAGGVGYAAGPAASIALLPLFSPRLVGRLTAFAGVGSREAGEAVQRLRGMAERLPNIGAIRSTVTVGELLERIEGTEETQRPRTPGVIGTLGRVR